MEPSPPSPLLQVEGLSKYFPVSRGVLFRREVGVARAVDGVTFTIPSGTSFGLVGESGCGKSTIGRMMVRLLTPTGGRVLFEGQDIAAIHGSDLHAMRRHVQMIFQDPFGSLDPRMRVGDIIAEPMDNHGLYRGAARQKRVDELLGVVGLASYHARRYPHQFSGGQRQRIGIARALAVNPKFVVLDEPVSALDVSVQAQVLNLLQDLQAEFQLTYLFIAHTLSVVEHVSHTVGVMYLGKLVEVAESATLYKTPQHPYTRALMSSTPATHPRLRRERITLTGEVPSPLNPPSGCRFRTRCPLAVDMCAQVEPPLKPLLGTQHLVACHVVHGDAVSNHSGPPQPALPMRGPAINSTRPQPVPPSA